MCEEKERLHHLYRIATLDYSRALMVLDAKRGVLSREEYSKVRELIEHARATSEAARAVLVGTLPSTGAEFRTDYRRIGSA